MTAGVNCRGKIWRWRFVTDDEVGGAHPTGSYIYNDVHAYFQEQPTEQLLLQQGLEVERIFQAVIFPSWYTIQERDEFEITAPTDHYHYGDRFRVISARPSSHNRRDPRGYMILEMTRSERSHAQQ